MRHERSYTVLAQGLDAEIGRGIAVRIADARRLEVGKVDMAVDTRVVRRGLVHSPAGWLGESMAADIDCTEESVEVAEEEVDCRSPYYAESQEGAAEVCYIPY